MRIFYNFFTLNGIPHKKICFKRQKILQIYYKFVKIILQANDKIELHQKNEQQNADNARTSANSLYLAETRYFASHFFSVFNGADCFF